jgi:penicillin-binding protein 1A
MKNLLSLIFRAIARYFLIIISVFVLFIAGIVGFCFFVELRLPDVNVLKDAHMQEPLRVYSREGELLAEYGANRRSPVALEQIPKPLIQAILATEDQRFYSHPGVDFIGLFRAFKVLAATGQKSQGASTITMQVARNFFLTHKKTYVRKIREIFLALKIERTLSKDKILELYLNRVYFGNHAYGVAAAANVYYGKTLDQLSLAEMAMIAGLPQAPSKNNPIARPAAATARRNHVLLRMEGVGDITKAQYQQAVNEADKSSYHGPLVSVNAPYVGEMVRQYMVQQYGEAAYEQGYSVYTTISAKLQNAATRDLQQALIGYEGRHRAAPTTLSQNNPAWRSLWLDQLEQMTLPYNVLQPAAVLSIASDQRPEVLLADGRSVMLAADDNNALKTGDVIWVRPMEGQWQRAALPQIQGALISLDPQTGEILALVGGFDFKLSEFNRVTQAQRQPGSVFKPFIYSAALDKGFTLASTINDAPVVVEDTGENSVWRPRNDTRQFSGITRVREGLVKSLNMVSIRLLEEAGVPYVADFVQRFGFEADQLPHTLSLALGTGLTSPLRVATGYSVFANGGYRITPFCINRIINQDHQVVFSDDPPRACADCANRAPQVIDAQNAYLMTRALQDVIVSGTAQAARALERSDLAGKTGTTNDKVDAWFSGFNSRIVTTVWVGYDDLKSTHEYGSGLALSIWMDFMRTALAGTPLSVMPQPPGIVTARIDPRTGLLAGPDQQDAIFEVFREGTEPHAQASGDSSVSSSNDIF